MVLVIEFVYQPYMQISLCDPIGLCEGIQFAVSCVR